MTSTPGHLLPAVATFDHVVHVYDTSTNLAEHVAQYLLPGLRDSAAVVVATPAHRRLIEARLAAAGVDVTGTAARGRYVSLDAEQTLAGFVVDGVVDPAGFDAVVGALVRRLAGSYGTVHAYGEMVACLWERGESSSAITLERCWNRLGQQSDLRLCCAYSASVLGEGSTCDVERVFEAHSHVTAA